MLNVQTKKTILDYLKREHLSLCVQIFLHDIFTGDTISYENCVLGDNKYIWSNELIYYVEKI